MNQYKELLGKLVSHFSDLPCKDTCYHYRESGDCKGCNAKNDIEASIKLLNKKEKQMEKEYEVIKPFNLHDLWQSQKDKTCKEFISAFQKLLFDLTYEDSYKFSYRFTSFNEEDIPVVLWSFREELCKRGFIKERKDVELKLGMVVINTDNGARFKICRDHYSDKIKMLELDSFEFYDCSETLNQLSKEKGCEYRIVEE